ncbi:MAG TPA: Spy/CpxP family protein refolding chaperone [Blastocatellia bacterium]|nr:Spy/CpxP family protein refolding chaperone [Blastocatellia bacterium]HMV84527.1 Spy/CpxP family protein refolding chaperone [Blastocatellia bacterium]HMX30028.1 Spy/CpxP family protein refolding chaperone [Blastocatellia bacterium]HMY74077.1 Spy/CpxP family protein refolding chaperone [Blastocatellia bacterium]HMZ17317.1 Spy/CpxP family protein refolding chaperone [Blastocatellia bacterium]
MSTKQHLSERKVRRFGVRSLAMLVGLLFLVSLETSAQAIRRPGKVQRQIQKKLDTTGTNDPTPVKDTSSDTPKPAETAVKQDFAQSQYPNLDGIRNRNILTMFSREEVQLIIPGFGRPPALLIVFRQLQLAPEQKEQIKAIRLRTGDRLAVLQRERAQLEQQIEDTIYGENFGVERVDELAAKAGEKQSEIIKIQANIEARFRQILTPDQFYVFQFLIGEMVLPQRRVNPQQLRQQQLRRLGPNTPTRPPLNEDN